MTPSLWSETAAPAPAAPPLAGAAACDIAIIGAGIFGLAAALALAAAGRRVIVLEAGTIGAGASGRNGGLVVPSLPRIGPAEVRAALPAAFAARLLALVAGGAAAVFDTIRRHGIDCDAVQAGWLQPAHAASRAPGLRARVAEWQAAGAGCVWLDAAAAAAHLGSTAFHGALFDPSGGHLDPLGYTRGLARAALGAGAAVHEASPVTAGHDQGGWRLVTPGGEVRAGCVLQATNAALPGLPCAAVRDSLVPLTVWQLATPPMPRCILPGDAAFSDTRNNLLACRWTAGGRLVTGALALRPRWLARRLERVFPALGPVRFSHMWQGRAALTGDFLPRLMQPAPGWIAASACNGRGIVLSTLLGRALADYLLSGDPAALPVPITPPRPFRAPALARLVPRLLLPFGDWQDRRR